MKKRSKGKEDTKKSEEEKTFESDDREHVESDDNDGGDDLILYSNRLILYVKRNMLILDYPVMVQEKDDPEPETPLLEENNSSKTEMDIDSCQVYEKILKRKNKVTKKKKKSSVEKHDFEASNDDGAKRDTGKRNHVDDYDLGNTSDKPKEKSKEKIQREDLVTAVKKVKNLIHNSSSNWKMHTINLWSSIRFEFVVKLDIMAMDPKERGETMKYFLQSRDSEEYYKRLGKAWKRGYLLYEPPWTGKIADMANLMSYSIYSLELTSIRKESELKTMFLAMTSKFITKLDDIYCSLDVTRERSYKISEQCRDQEEKEG